MSSTHKKILETFCKKCYIGVEFVERNMSEKLIVRLLKGLPGSGKSTYAKEVIKNEPNKWKRVNRDSLRLMLSEEKNDRNEKFLLQIRDNLITQFLAAGYCVIVDDLNLSPKHEARIRQLVGKKATVETKDDFMAMELDQLIYRNNNRPESEKVPEKIIRQLYEQFCKSVVSKEEKAKIYHEKTVERFYIPYNPDLPDCYLFDVDGTLALMNGRAPYDWHRVGEDLPNEPVVRILRFLYNNSSASIFIVSGRDGICKEETKLWLDTYEIPYTRVFMRDVGNNEKDAIIKERIYRENFEGQWNVLAVFDDRSSVVQMWRELGLLCLQVAPGDF